MRNSTAWSNYLNYDLAVEDMSGATEGSLPVRAVILAAGRGSRLHPYTENCPKCLTELGGMALIERQLATLQGAGITDIVIVTGYLGEMLKLPGTRRIDNPRWQTTNMVESLFAAEADFGNDLIVAYSDIIYEPRVLAALLESHHDISVITDHKWRDYWECRFEDPLSDAESLRLDDRDRITDIGQKVADISEIQSQFTGLLRFQGDGVQTLRDTKAALGNPSRPWMRERPLEQAYMTDLLMEMILNGHSVHAVPIEHGWLEIDTVKDYEDAARMIADGNISRFFNPETLTDTVLAGQQL